MARRGRAQLADKLPAPTHISVKSIIRKAERDGGLVTIESLYTGVGYVMDTSDFVIITEHGGVLRLNKSLMRKVLEEALECMEVMA